MKRPEHTPRPFLNVANALRDRRKKSIQPTISTAENQ